MTARYNTGCRNCGGRITRGEEIARDGRTYVHAECAGGARIGGTCEDAPCCGCCGPQGDGDYYGYAAAEAAAERGYF